MKLAGFALFILLFTGIYGGFHVYAFYKLKPLFLHYQWLLILILALLGCSIFLVATLTWRGNESAIMRPLAFITFSWMGIVFLFFAISIPLDFIAWVAGKVSSFQLHTYLVATSRTIVVGIAVILIAVYGYYSSLQVHIERLSFQSSKISRPIKLVQITDLHLGLLSDKHYIKKVVDQVNALDADIVVSTGDLVDMQMDHLDGLSKLLSGISARYGKYAIMGNHEAMAGVANSRVFTERIGFKLLNNSGLTIDNAVNLAGVDDPAVAGRVQQLSETELALLKRFDNGLYTILLKHQPVVVEESTNLFDLQLSGHTHGGQIFPFNLLIHLFYKAPFGLSKQGDNSWLYVSRGTGTWGPPMRVLAKPEITLIQLQNGEDNEDVDK